jgi:chromatin segregation and condensation protein Rec8/ScpA/Scc1 (kleisin family)
MKNNVNLFSSLKDNTSNFNSLEKINFNKFSSRHLFISNESKMYADLFEIIIELYKSKKISLEQKLKLKKLIICKNPQILSVYKYFDVDNEKFIKQLKKIIQ